jgi:hypothetical protein
MWMFFFNSPGASAANSSLSYESLRPYLPTGKTSLSAAETYLSIFKSVLVPMATSPDFVDSRFFPSAIYDSTRGEVNARLYAMLTATRLSGQFVPGYFYLLDKPADLAAGGVFADKFNRQIMPALKKALPAHPITILAEVKKNEKGADVLVFSSQLAVSPDLKTRLIQACAAGANTAFRYTGSDAAEFTADPLQSMAQQLLGPSFIENALQMNLCGTLTLPLFQSTPGGRAPTPNEKKADIERFYRPFITQFNTHFAPAFSQVGGNPLSVRASFKDGREGKSILITFEPSLGVPAPVSKFLSEKGISIRA